MLLYFFWEVTRQGGCTSILTKGVVMILTKGGEAVKDFDLVLKILSFLLTLFKTVYDIYRDKKKTATDSGSDGSATM